MRKTIYLIAIGVLILLNALIYSCNRKDESQTANMDTRQPDVALVEETEVVEVETEPAADADSLEVGQTAQTEAETDEKPEALAEKKESKAVEKPVKMTPPPKPVNRPILKFDVNELNFGYINIGDKVERYYNFTNIGKEPLIVTNATTTCGCTIPEWPKEPIPPGERGHIKVVFDSTGKIGVQDKTVSVFSNAGSRPTVIHLKGIVTTPPKKEEQPAESGKAGDGTPTPDSGH